MNVKELIRIMPGIISVTGTQEADVNSVADDSRKSKKGALFVAVSGIPTMGMILLLMPLAREPRL